MRLFGVFVFKHTQQLELDFTVLVTKSTHIDTTRELVEIKITF